MPEIPVYTKDAKKVVLYGLDINDQLLKIGVDSKGDLYALNKLWNTETWDWEASTKGSGTGEAVNVENFPAVISGASVPVNDETMLSVLNSILTKITGLVFVTELGSFVATVD